MSKDEWVESLKVGDEVVVDSTSYGVSRYQAATVERLTATQIAVSARNHAGKPRRFRRVSWASEIGSNSTYHTPNLKPMTNELRTAIEEQKLREWFAGLVRVKINTKALRAMKAAYDANRRETSA
jgi:hypothetical protein